MNFPGWLGLALIAAAAAPAGMDAQWPQFRGPVGTGLSPVAAPIELGPTRGLLWKADTGQGHSSPVVWGDRLFLTAGDKETRKLEVLCLERTTGKVLWRRSVTAEAVEPLHQVANPAVSTPAVDGKRVYAYFGSYGLLAYDFDGNPQWTMPLPVAKTRFGSATSPIVAGDAVILSRDENADGYLLAVHRDTGKELWRQLYTVPNGPGAAGAATPVVWRDEIVVHRGGEIVAFDRRDGTPRWWVGVRSTSTGTPAVGSDVVYVGTWFPVGEPDLRVPLPDFASLLKRADRDADGVLAPDEVPDDIQLAQRVEVDVAGANIMFPGRNVAAMADRGKDGKVDKDDWGAFLARFTGTDHALMAIRPGGRGDVTATHVLWREPRGVPEVPAPLVAANRVYMVTNGGIVTCLDSASGSLLYRSRLGAGGAYYASPVMAGGHVYFASGDGVVSVVRDAEAFSPVARNDLGAPIFATPAAVDGVLYVRAGGHLYAFGKK
jgi:outer membrane protein assembly factor BamB